MYFLPCCPAFLLNNGLQYHAAHIIGLLEYFITAFLVDENDATTNDIILFRRWWMGYGSLVIGGCFLILPMCERLIWYSTLRKALPLVCAGQALRSLAMVHAADSFSHVVSRTKEKQEGHVLVTWGVYR